MGMRVRVRVDMGMAVIVVMVMSVIMRVSCLRVVMVPGQVNVEVDALNTAFMAAADVQVVAIQSEFAQFLFELPAIDAEIEQGADKHVAADAAEQIEVEGLHSAFLRRQRVDLGGRVAGPKAVVNIDDR